MLLCLQEEEQDPLLNNFSHLKDVLNSISGKKMHVNLSNQGQHFVGLIWANSVLVPAAHLWYGN